MSSTLQPTRAGTDFYATPEWCTRAIMPYLRSLFASHREVNILEPAAGSGAICRVLSESFRSPVYAIDVNPQWDTAHSMIRRYESVVLSGAWSHDFLQIPASPTFDLVITNPPYNQAFPFVLRAMDWIRPGGCVAMLLRMGFLEGAERHDWLRENVPDVAVLTRRPSFDAPHPPKCTGGKPHAWLRANDARHFLDHVGADGFDLDGRWRCTQCGVRKKGSDSATYAWMLWPHRSRTAGQTLILPYWI